MSGKHAHARTPRLLRNKFVPLISAVALAGVLVGAATAAMSLGPATDSPTTTAAQAAANLSPSPSDRGTDDRASRSELRAMPSPTPSPTPSSTPSAKPTNKATQPSGGGTVTSSGTCGASYYGSGSHTANGETFDPSAYTAANKTMPFNTRVRVTNTANGKSVIVRINDRGPYVSGRCLDLTTAAFAVIASLGSGVITVKYEVLS